MKTPPTTPEQLTLQDMESTLDNVANEIINLIEPKEQTAIFDLYIAFREAVQERIQAMHPDTEFGNF